MDNRLDRRLAAMVDFVQSNHNQHLPVGMLAKMAGLSATQLDFSDSSIAQIAAECGCDQAAFAHPFRRFAGLSPSEYRRLRRTPVDGLSG